MAAVHQRGTRILLQSSHVSYKHAFRSFSGGCNRPTLPRPASLTCRKYQRGEKVRSASSESFESSGAQEPEAPAERDFTPFPRINERDPYRRLGLRRDASFEEVIDAKNFLYEQYKWHVSSKESIELAFDSVIQDKLKARFKFGFRPPRTGRRTDAIGDPIQKSPLEKFLGLWDPSVTPQSIMSEGVIYFALAAWAFLTRDVSLPLASTFLYSIYRFYSKRKLLNPDGPYFGGTPVFGAVVAGGASLGLGALTGMAVVKAATLATSISPFMVLIVQAISTILTAGLVSICLR